MTYKAKIMREKVKVIKKGIILQIESRYYEIKMITWLKKVLSKASKVMIMW